MNFLYLYIILSTTIVFTCGRKTNERQIYTMVTPVPVYQWAQLEFCFPNSQDKQMAEASGNLIPSNAIPIDVQPDYSRGGLRRTFVTIPRFQKGIPYTLATVSKNEGPNGPQLQPYPNYAAHNNNDGRNCDAISSAFRMAITECNQMWVIDAGSYTQGGPHCAPQLLLFDLSTNKLVHRYRFQPLLYIPGASLFITPIVDVRDQPPQGSCKNTMIYVADVSNHGLVVYDYKQDKAWRIENRFMYPDPNHGLLTVAAEEFVLMDGIFGMAIDKTNLYFHPLASKTEYSVPLAIINKSALFEENVENMQEEFKAIGRRSSACAASAMDCNNNLYCVTLNPIELTVWNMKSRNTTTLSINPSDLEFVSGMKVVRNHWGIEELWMLSNRFQKMAAGTQNFNEVNFRIVVRPLMDIYPSETYNDYYLRYHY